MKKLIGLTVSVTLGLALVSANIQAAHGSNQTTTTDSTGTVVISESGSHNSGDDSDSESDLDEPEHSSTVTDESDKESEEVKQSLDRNYVRESILNTLNSKDTTYVKLVHKDIEYDKDSKFTRIDLALTLTELLETTYSTDLIEMTDVFDDVSDLTEDEIGAIESVYIMGLMGYKSDGKFLPNDILTELELNIVLDRIASGYTRKNLFNHVNSCFTDNLREETLVKYHIPELQTISLLEIPDLIDTKDILKTLNLAEDKSISFEDTLTILNNKWKTKGNIFNKRNGEWIYLVNDSKLLSSEEWEYINTHLMDDITMSEFLVLFDRINELRSVVSELGEFDDWDKLLSLSKDYIGFIYPLIENNRDCFQYFLEFGNENYKRHNSLFARAVHECQHEEFLSISRVPFMRQKGTMIWSTWAIEPLKDTEVFYYYDYTNKTWAASEDIENLPWTAEVYETLSDELKANSTIKAYATGDDQSSNELGIQGLLSEFCSFAIESKVEATRYSLGLGEAWISSIDYKTYKSIADLTIEYIKFMQGRYPELYADLASDIKVGHTINNIINDMNKVALVFGLN